MTLEEYPDDAEIVATNFKTDQQANAAERIEQEWPVDLDRLAEEGQHVKMFYKQVLDQFLGPVEADATFADLKDEYGSLEQWADSDDENEDEDESAADVDVPDVEDIEPETNEASPSPTANDDPSQAVNGDQSAAETVTAAVDIEGDAMDDVDDRRRAWFRAGFSEGVEFALKNPELFDRD